MKYVFLVLLCVLGIVYGYSTSLTQTSYPSDLTQTPYPSESQIQELEKRTMADMEYVVAQIDRKVHARDYTDVVMPDGRRISVTYTPTGGVCPRSGLPNMHVTYDYESIISYHERRMGK